MVVAAKEAAAGPVDHQQVASAEKIAKVAEEVEPSAAAAAAEARSLARQAGTTGEAAAA